MSGSLLGSFEELVLLAVKRLQVEDDAYGLSIQSLLSEATGQPVVSGAVYTTLHRLEEKGFVESERTDPLPKPGGRSKRVFRVTGEGELVLEAVRRARMMLELGFQGGIR